LNNDFVLGSLPDANGRTKDLWQNGIDAMIRPTTASMTMSFGLLRMDNATSRYNVAPKGSQQCR